METDVKRYAVLLNLGLFCLTVWYCIAQLLLTVVWQNIWH